MENMPPAQKTEKSEGIETAYTAGEPQTKRSAKDTVFRDLFKDRRNALELYLAIHPEDKDVTLKDITNVTIENVITDQEYNDLGMTVRGKLLLLLEAQSTWTYNIIVRILLYLVHTWNIYLKETKQDRYGRTKVQLPKPELYVVFTGERAQKPKWINLADAFFEGDDKYLNVKVSCLYGTAGGRDILSQYIDFTKVYNEQVQLYGKEKKAALETIRICKDKDVLREYLTNREKEVVDIMMALFDEQEVQEQFGNGRYQEGKKEGRLEGKKEGRLEGKKEGRLEGKKEGRLEQAERTARNLHNMGMEEDFIAKAVNVSVDVVKKWLGIATI